MSAVRLSSVENETIRIPYYNLVLGTFGAFVCRSLILILCVYDKCEIKSNLEGSIAC